MEVGARLSTGINNIPCLYDKDESTPHALNDPETGCGSRRHGSPAGVLEVQQTGVAIAAVYRVREDQVNRKCVPPLKVFACEYRQYVRNDSQSLGPICLSKLTRSDG
jgi:hypothetical protein